ncbi:MAG: FxsA family protein [Magnetovibrionaceae bacterium]
MGLVLLILMIGIPIAEIAVFIQVGDLIGLWPTLASVIITAIIGTSLLRYQGFQTLAKVQNSLDQGELPMAAVFDGLCLLVAGALLLTPGFLTDAIGFALFVPPLRAVLGQSIAQWMVRSGKVQVHGNGVQGGAGFRPQSGQDPRPQGRAGPVIEGEFEEVEPGQPKPDSPWHADKSDGPKP